MAKKELSLSQAWIQSVHLANERRMVKMCFPNNKFNRARIRKLDAQIKENLGVVVEKGTARRG